MFGTASGESCGRGAGTDTALTRRTEPADVGGDGARVESFDWAERQAKFIVNSVRVYEGMGTTGGSHGGTPKSSVLDSVPLSLRFGNRLRNHYVDTLQGRSGSSRLRGAGPAVVVPGDPERRCSIQVDRSRSGTDSREMSPVAVAGTSAVLVCARRAGDRGMGLLGDDARECLPEPAIRAALTGDMKPSGGSLSSATARIAVSLARAAYRRFKRVIRYRWNPPVPCHWDLRSSTSSASGYSA